MSKLTHALERAIVAAREAGDIGHAQDLKRELVMRIKQEREAAAGLDPFRHWRDL